LGLGNEAKWEYLYDRYYKAEREARAALLSEFCGTTGYNRKYAIRLLNGPRPEKERVRRPREHKPQYGKQVISVLAAVWEAAGYPWSVRLKALLPSWMPWIRKRYRLSAKLEQQLLAMSARQMARRLQSQAGAEAENLSAHQTRSTAEALHSDKDGQLGRKSARIH
jgi:hypothetical protein